MHYSQFDIDWEDPAICTVAKDGHKSESKEDFAIKLKCLYKQVQILVTSAL